MTPAQAKNMRFTLRYPTDKILEVYPGTFDIAAAASTLVSRRAEVTIPHTFGTTCFLELIFSTDGGTTWQDMDMAKPDLSGTPVFQTVTVAAYSTTTDFVVVGTNQTTSSTTIDYIMVAEAKT
jgi:hypothetical protein